MSVDVGTAVQFLVKQDNDNPFEGEILSQSGQQLHNKRDMFLAIRPVDHDLLDHA